MIDTTDVGQRARINLEAHLERIAAVSRALGQLVEADMLEAIAVIELGIDKIEAALDALGETRQARARKANEAAEPKRAAELRAEADAIEARVAARKAPR